MGKRENVRGTTQYSYGMYAQKERAFSSKGKEAGKYEQDLAASMEFLQHIVILIANFARLSIILYFAKRGFHTWAAYFNIMIYSFASTWGSVLVENWWLQET